MGINGGKIKKVWIKDANGTRELKKVWNKDGNKLIFNLNTKEPLKVSVSFRARYDTDWQQNVTYDKWVTVSAQFPKDSKASINISVRNSSFGDYDFDATLTAQSPSTGEHRCYWDADFYYKTTVTASTSFGDTKSVTDNPHHGDYTENLNMDFPVEKQ